MEQPASMTNLQVAIKPFRRAPSGVLYALSNKQVEQNWRENQELGRDVKVGGFTKGGRRLIPRKVTGLFGKGRKNYQGKVKVGLGMGPLAKVKERRLTRDPLQELLSIFRNLEGFQCIGSRNNL